MKSSSDNRCGDVSISYHHHYPMSVNKIFIFRRGHLPPLRPLFLRFTVDIKSTLHGRHLVIPHIKPYFDPSQLTFCLSQLTFSKSPLFRPFTVDISHLFDDGEQIPTVLSKFLEFTV